MYRAWFTVQQLTRDSVFFESLRHHDVAAIEYASQSGGGLAPFFFILGLLGTAMCIGGGVAYALYQRDLFLYGERSHSILFIVALFPLMGGFFLLSSSGISTLLLFGGGGFLSGYFVQAHREGVLKLEVGREQGEGAQNASSKNNSRRH